MSNLYLDCTTGTNPDGEFEINDIGIRNIKKEIDNAYLLDTDTLTVYLNSCGGNPFMGFILHSLIKNLKCNTVCYAIQASSAAFIPFLAFDRKILRTDGCCQIHNTSAPISVPSGHVTQHDIVKNIESLRITDDSMANIISKNIESMNKNDIFRLMEINKTFHPIELYSLNVIDELCETIQKNPSTIVIHQ